MVIWTEPAKSDLKHIYNFIADNSSRYARKVVREIVAKADILNKTPRIGKVVPEVKDEKVRELHLYSYRILYELKDQRIEILAIVHKRRNFQAEDIQN